MNDRSYHVESRELTGQPTAAVRASLSPGQPGGWLAGAYQDVIAYLSRAHVTPAGPPYARLTFYDDLVHIEAGFPVSSPVVAGGRVMPSSLPGGPVALTTHYGRYEDVPAAYDAIAGWLKEHGYEPAEPHWEVYFTTRRPNPIRPGGVPTSSRPTAPAEQGREARVVRVRRAGGNLRDRRQYGATVGGDVSALP